ncbi:HalOD1 output domain-containing protein [Natrinema versiforme]|uniref:Halobacterial output domain-containing protein n=1 Tax=Natrinema versiforme JCM 10478 TaxID=1227496 RepID=L9Y1R5_9EURY|nr:HalOD1 output domain-containing protein [Natrinema versiforme]ELY68009.1 hypothetical protein C489_08395 [Natrinema versiforme JCM 10478]
MTDPGPIEYDIETNSYRAQFDFTSIEPSVAVIDALEAITDRESTALPPLYEAIDPEGLDAVIESTQRTPHPDQSSVSFPYQGFLVTVFGDGTLEVAVGGDEGSSDK